GRVLHRFVPKVPTAKSIDHLAFSPDGKTLTFVAYGAKPVLLALDMETHKIRWQKDEINGWTAFSPDSLHIAARADTRIFVMDVPTGKELTGAGNAASTPAPDLEFAPDSRGIWHAKQDELCLWDLPSGQLRATLRHEKIATAAVAPDGRW